MKTLDNIMQGIRWTGYLASVVWFFAAASMPDGLQMLFAFGLGMGILAQIIVMHHTKESHASSR
jgi:hypothetical protein